MGCIHIYTGDGKGKTTAAMGLVLRSVGCGNRPLVVQFLKGGKTGELDSLARLNVPVLRNGQNYGFFRTLSESDRTALLSEQNEMLQKVQTALQNKVYDLIVLDEIIGAYQLGAVDQTLVENLLKAVPYEAELVLTGRNAPQWVRESADYVTVMEKEKHPFDCGISARRGVEF